MNGNEGSDTLYGLDGSDWLNGGSGIDTLIGGQGDDNYFVTDSRNIVSEEAGAGRDTVWGSVDYTLGDNVEDFVAVTDDGVTVRGNSLSNYLAGRAGADYLDGGGRSGRSRRRRGQ